MPGDAWQQFANMRLLFGFMYTITGKKLMFMGGEIGQWNEWNHDGSLDWHLLDYPLHRGLQKWVTDLNHVYKNERALFELDKEGGGFEWIDCGDWEQSILVFMRTGKKPKDTIVVACNFTPVPRHNYMIGVPHGGYWKEILNSDATVYGGGGQGNYGGVEASPVSVHGRRYAVALTIPPLGCVMLKAEDKQV
jgi:1,4-alpha-glucan branching enzyme